MGIFADRMAELDIRLSSPDRSIHARLSSGERVEVWFAEGSYDRYTEAALERQLISLARRLLVARGRARQDAFREALGDRFRPHRGPLDDPRQRRFRAELAKLVAVGRTPWVEITASPGEFWVVRIEPGTLARLSETQFLMELHFAIDQGMTDMRRQLLSLREDIYDQRLPESSHRGARPWK